MAHVDLRETWLVASFADRLLDLFLGSLDTSLQIHLLFASPVVIRQVAIPLRQLGTLIDKVACEKEIVLGCNGERVSHEGGGVDAQRARHLSRDSGMISFGGPSPRPTET